MNYNHRPLLAMTIASIKMYFRDFTAIFFTFLFPVIFLVVFGFVASSDSISLDVALVNNSDTQISQNFDEAFAGLTKDDSLSDDINKDRVFRLDTLILTEEEARQAVKDGDITAAFIVPESFGDASQGIPPGQITAVINESAGTFGQTATTIVESTLAQFNDQANKQVFGVEPISPFTVEVETTTDSGLSGVDYIVPGIIAFSVLSLGIFSISQGFISYKSSGALRRLFVTPINPFNFIVAQMITRLLVVLINVWTMVLLAVILFDFKLIGSFVDFSLVALFGSVMFLGIGFALAGWAKNENQAAPLSNIVFFPMMFLSGTFFPRELFPEWLQPITGYLPLSYVADSLRLIANEGSTVLDLGPQMLGMFIWTAVIYLIAIKVFRWE